LHHSDVSLLSDFAATWFANVEDSGVAGADLLRRKYNSGTRTARQIIAGNITDVELRSFNRLAGGGHRSTAVDHALARGGPKAWPGATRLRCG
jgi:hypothetical protein